MLLEVGFGLFECLRRSKSWPCLHYIILASGKSDYRPVFSSSRDVMEGRNIAKNVKVGSQHSATDQKVPRFMYARDPRLGATPNLQDLRVPLCL